MALPPCMDDHGLCCCAALAPRRRWQLDRPGPARALHPREIYAAKRLRCRSLGCGFSLDPARKRLSAPRGCPIIEHRFIARLDAALDAPPNNVCILQGLMQTLSKQSARNAEVQPQPCSKHLAPRPSPAPRALLRPYSSLPLALRCCLNERIREQHHDADLERAAAAFYRAARCSTGTVATCPRSSTDTALCVRPLAVHLRVDG